MSWENHLCENGHDSTPMDRVRSWMEDGAVHIELACPTCGAAYVANEQGERREVTP